MIRCNAIGDLSSWVVCTAILLTGISAFSGCTNEPLDVPCPDINQGELVITEIHGPQSGEDGYGEWIELYNAGERSVDLSGLSVSILKLDGSKDAHFWVRSSVIMAAGSYLVFGKQLPGEEPAHVDYGYISDIDTKLYDSAAVIVESCGIEIDLAVYRNLPSKGSYILSGNIAPPSSSDNDNEANWCVDSREDNNSPSAGIRGTPQEENPICP